MARYHGIATLCFFLMLFVAPARAQVLPMTPTPTIAPPPSRKFECGAQATPCPIHQPETSTTLTISGRNVQEGDNCCAMARASCAKHLKSRVEEFIPKAKCSWCFEGGCKPTLTWPDKWWELSENARYGFGTATAQSIVITSCEVLRGDSLGRVTCKATCKLHPDFLANSSNCPTIGCSTCGTAKNESAAATQEF
jgi:hypothetical protein